MSIREYRRIPIPATTFVPDSAGKLYAAEEKRNKAIAPEGSNDGRTHRTHTRRFPIRYM